MVLKLPTSPWPTDPYLKDCGRWYNLGLLEAVEGLSLAPLTRVGGWSVEEVKNLLVSVRRDIKNRRIHAYSNMYAPPLPWRVLIANTDDTGTSGSPEDRTGRPRTSHPVSNEQYQDSPIPISRLYYPRPEFLVTFIVLYRSGQLKVNIISVLDFFILILFITHPWDCSTCNLFK